MAKTMKQVAPQMTEEQKKEQMMRAYLQKKAALAEGVIFNLIQGKGAVNESDAVQMVKVADVISSEFMKVIYKANVEEE